MLTTVERALLHERRPITRDEARDSRVALRRQGFRRAVIDAATASELALTRAAETQMGSMSAPLREATLKRFRQLAGRVELARALGLSLPPDIVAKVAEPRNKAAHAGADPTRSAAQAAIKVATDVVAKFVPLPKA